MSLETQDKCEQSTKTLNPLSRKIGKILETHLENDKDTIDALRELSTFFVENNMRSRRNLRGQIERRSVAINEDLVKALKNVKISVDNIYSEVSLMNDVCLDMKRRLQMTKSETHHLIQQTNALQTQSKKLKLQEQVADAFMKTFQLSPEEISCLRGRKHNTVMTQEFFDALDKIQSIRKNTKYLLHTGCQKTALDVMEQMNLNREAALERLYRWLQQQTCSPDPSCLMPRALVALEERPVLFNLIIEEWTIVRRGWLVQGFLDALTVGGMGGAPRPIEVQAHDPLRYVGDMLAWVHQALPSEREAAQTLFSKCTNIDVTEKTKATVGSISESVCRPLKTRIEQMIVSDQSREGGKKPVQLYKISSLLHFYQNTIAQVTGPGLLVTTLEELQSLSYKMFIHTLRKEVSQACERVEPPGETLAPTAGVAQTLALLTDVLTAATVSDDTQQDFKQIVDCVLDPLINAINECASGLGTIESAIYLLNCLYQLHSTLSLLHTSSDKVEMIQGQIDAQLDTLSQEQINAVFHSLNLATMYPVILHPPPSSLSQHSACQPLAVQSFRTKLDAFLSAPDHLMLPHTRLLLSSSYRRQLHHKTCLAITSVFERLYALVSDPAHGYTDPTVLLPRDPETVKALLL